MSGDHCAVTGAAGFVGLRLVRALAASGVAVSGLDRRALPESVPGVGHSCADICDRAALASAFEGADTVFHLTALLPQRHADTSEMRRVNVGGTVAVAEVAREAGVRRLVHLSSSEVYGIPAVVPCPEDAPLEPIGEYGRNKVEAEDIVRNAEGLDSVILRPPTIVGPDMREPLFEILFPNAARGWPLVVVGGGRSRLQMVSVDDVVQACLLARSVPAAAGHTLNIGYEPVPTLREVIFELRERLELRSPVVSVPLPVAKPLVWLAARMPRVPLEPEHARLAFEDYVTDSRKARAVLGWESVKSPVDALIEAYEAR